MRRIFVFWGIVFAVLVSGCTAIDIGGGGSSFAMGSGLQVNSFEFKPAKILSGQATLLKLELQNMGSLNIEDVDVYLYGLSGQWFSGGSSLVGGSCGGSDLRHLSGCGGLRAANAEFKTEGQKVVVTWKLNSPEEYMQGTEFVHKAYARVCYEYETGVLAKVEVIGENEWLLSEQTGSFSQHPIDVKQTTAPLQISIESMQPIVVDTGMSMELRITNVGGGTAFSGTKSCRDVFDGSDVDVALDLNNIKIEGLQDVNGCKIYGLDGTDTSVLLSRGQEKTVFVKCDGFSSDLPKQEFSLGFKLSYSYYIDSEASVVLTGVEGEEEGV